jgi:hypothetical protein
MQASEILCGDTPELNNLSSLRVCRGRTAIRPQNQEQDTSLGASRLGGFQHTPAEARKITDRLLTFESGAFS